MTNIKLIKLEVQILKHHNITDKQAVVFASTTIMINSWFPRFPKILSSIVNYVLWFMFS